MAGKRHSAAELAAGVAVLLVEQLIEKALALADRVVILDRGRVAADLTPGDLLDGAVRGFAARFLSLGEPEG